MRKSVLLPMPLVAGLLVVALVIQPPALDGPPLPSATLRVISPMGGLPLENRPVAQTQQIRIVVSAVRQEALEAQDRSPAEVAEAGLSVIASEGVRVREATAGSRDWIDVYATRQDGQIRLELAFRLTLPAAEAAGAPPPLELTQNLVLLLTNGQTTTLAALTGGAPDRATVNVEVTATVLPASSRF